MKNIWNIFLSCCSISLTFLPFMGCSQYGYERRGMFENIDAVELIMLLLIILIYSGLFILIIRSRLRVYRPGIILDKFIVDNSGSTQKPIEIIGHEYGLKSWLLSGMGFGSEMKLSVYNSKISFKRSGLISGETHLVIPLINVSGSSFGYSKPFEFLIFSLIFLVLGRYLLVFYLLGVILIAVYFLLPGKIFINLKIIDRSQVSFSFKPDVVDNIDVNIEQAHKVINIINDCILKQHNNI